MEHCYQNIHGYMHSIDNFYDYIVNDYFKDDDNLYFVEIGNFYGKSACYMGVNIVNSKKNITFDLIDLHPYPELIGNISRFPFINFNRGHSTELSLTYNDASLDFVFIDADHSYESVMNDITSWIPKVKPGGILAGHDYWEDNSRWPGVIKAVDEYFNNDDVSFIGSCWYVKIGDNLSTKRVKIRK